MGSASQSSCSWGAEEEEELLHPAVDAAAARVARAKMRGRKLVGCCMVAGVWREAGCAACGFCGVLGQLRAVAADDGECGGVAVGAGGKYMEDMALRTTVVLTDEDEQALREASRREGVSQSELIRRGVRMVTAAYRRRGGPSVGWLRLSGAERKALEADEFGDFDG